MEMAALARMPLEQVRQEEFAFLANLAQG
jgi:hypothetical protein